MNKRRRHIAKRRRRIGVLRQHLFTIRHEIWRLQQMATPVKFYERPYEVAR